MPNKADSLVHLKEMVGGAGITSIFAAVGSLLTFFFTIFAARYFGPEDYGVYTLVTTILALAVLIAGLGLLNGVPRFISLYKSGKTPYLLSGYIRFIFITLIISSAVVGSLIFFLSEKITIFFAFPSSLNTFLKIIAFLVPIKIIKATLRQIFLGYKKIIYQQFTYNVIEKLVLVLGTLYIIFMELDLYGFMIVFAASICIPFFVDVYLYKRKITMTGTDRLEYRSKEWFSFSLPLLFTGVFSFLISSTDNLFIGKMLEPSQLGIYSVAYSLASLLGFFQKSFASLFIPLITENYAKKDHGKISLLFRKATAWTFGLTFPVFLVFAAYSEQFITLVYGSSYGAGYLPLFIITIGFLINITTGPNFQILILHKRTKTIFLIESFTIAINIILNILLIPKIGIVGAALTTAISIALQNILFLGVARRLEKIRFEWKYILKFIVAGIPAVVLAAGLFRIGLPPYIATFLSLFLYVILYALFLLLLRTFTETDFQMMLAIEKKIGINLGFIKKLIKRFY